MVSCQAVYLVGLSWRRSNDAALHCIAMAAEIFDGIHTISFQPKAGCHKLLLFRLNLDERSEGKDVVFRLSLDEKKLSLSES